MSEQYPRPIIDESLPNQWGLRQPDGHVVFLPPANTWSKLLKLLSAGSYVPRFEPEYRLLLGLAEQGYAVRGVQPGIIRPAWFITDAGLEHLAWLEGEVQS